MVGIVTVYELPRNYVFIFTFTENQTFHKNFALCMKIWSYTVYVCMYVNMYLIFIFRSDSSHQCFVLLNLNSKYQRYMYVCVHIYIYVYIYIYIYRVIQYLHTCALSVHLRSYMFCAMKLLWRNPHHC